MLARFLDGKAFGLLLFALFLVSIFPLSLISLVQSVPLPYIMCGITSGSDDGYLADGYFFFPSSERIFWAERVHSVCSFFRFPVPIPRDAVIEGASLWVQPYHSDSGEVSTITIRAFAEDNAEAPTNGFDLINRQKTNADQYDIYISPSLTDVIQEIVLRDGWSSGNYLVIISEAEASPSPRQIWSREGFEAGEDVLFPMLVLSYRDGVAPQVSFFHRPETPVVDETVTFASTSTDPDGSISTWEWDFGDGDISFGAAVEHAYETAGTYEVKLTVTDNDGLYKTTTQSINVEKKSSSISVSASSTSFAVGGSTTISGYLSPALEGVGVTIHCKPSGGAWTNLSTVTTASDGGYSYTWTPTTGGEYTVKASWEGDYATMPSESPLQTLTVQQPVQQPTYTLTITVDPPEGGETDPTGVNTYTAGEEVSVTFTPFAGYELDYWELNGVNVGEEETCFVNMDADHTLRALVTESPAAFSWLPLLAGVAVAAAAVGLVAYKIVLPWWRKPRLWIQAEPEQIIADGKSKSTISVQLQDRKGKPMEAAEDIGATLTTKPPLGRIENPKPSISKGKDSALTSLVSPKDIDEETKVIELLAVAEGLKGHKTKITLLKLSRYCMGCGTKLSVEAQRVGECEICRRKVTDFRGTPLWTCKECTRKGRETHNPFNAKFCPECGASKPGKE
jgi:PKD repeat protein